MKSETIGSHTLHLADCVLAMETMPAASVDAIVTDPPYGLSFMGKAWDHGVPSVEVWREALRVLKPGGHLLSFGGSRTYHRMAVAIEDAGFEIRDQIMWIYGSGFPKSLDVSKAIDKAAGADREVTGISSLTGSRKSAFAAVRNDSDSGFYGSAKVNYATTAATEAAKQWDGWGTALKPAHEPIVVARKPIVGTVAANVMAHGTGAINVDGCRINPGEAVVGGGGLKGGAASRHEGWQRQSHMEGEKTEPHSLGRWPANVIHDGSEEVVALFPDAGGGDQRGQCNGRRPGGFGDVGADNGEGEPNANVYADLGSAARFFYCAKADKEDRGKGNNHPTVKPTDLMRYLVRMVTPPGGVVMDCFMGSGTTGKAAVAEGFRFVGIEREEESYDTACRRVRDAMSQFTPPLFF